jgi:acetate kinase
MKILVANLGSTSFKYRLFDLPDEGGAEGGVELARGGVERVGAAESRVYASLGAAEVESVMPVPDHGVALEAASTRWRRWASRRCMAAASAASCG